MRFSRLKQKQTPLIIVALIAVFGLINIISGQRIAHTASRPFFSVGGFFYVAQQRVRLVWTGITHGTELQRTVIEQEEHIAQLQHALARAGYPLPEEQDATFSRLSEELGVPIISAIVVSMSTNTGAHILFISSSAINDELLQQPVVTPQGVLLGKIIHVYQHRAAVQLITDPNSVIAATVAGKKDTESVVRGRLGATLAMELIPQDAEIESGDTVATSLLEEQTPPGLAIGAVDRVDHREGQLFKQASVIPSASPLYVTSVGIIAR